MGLMEESYHDFLEREVRSIRSCARINWKYEDRIKEALRLKDKNAQREKLCFYCQDFYC